MAYSEEIRHDAKILYLRKLTPTEISERLKIPLRTIYDWIKSGDWESLVSHESVEEGLARRINILSFKENKTVNEIRELKVSCSALLDFKKVELAEVKLRLLAGGDKKLGSNPDGSKRKRKEKKVKNDIGHLTQDDFVKQFHSKLFWHQKVLHKNRKQRNREIQKPRQGGYTWYFAGEAFERAVLDGDNSIFVSASRNQAEVFLAYIKAMALEWFDIELTGNPIVLSNGAILRPVSTNGKTAQSYTGHVYMDEYSWIGNFKAFHGTAMAMASHHHWTRTLFSTPSSKQHEAYEHWMAKVWKSEHPRNKKPWPTPEELADGGAMCPDGRWRFAADIEKLCAMGFTLIKVEEVKQENSKHDYSYLYMLQWIDGQSSAFDVNQLNKCIVDSARRWKDVNHDLVRPYGNGLVRLGYDPSRTKDNACVVVVAEPTPRINKHRVLEKLTWHNVSFEYQRNQIETLTKKYNVSFLGIDVTGIGYGVYELIQNIDGFSKHKISPIKYSPETKTDLVLRALNIIKNKRLQFDQEHKGIAAAFLTVKKKVTKQTATITYASNRTEATGHADEAWAVMNALSGEPLNYESKQESTWA